MRKPGATPSPIVAGKYFVFLERLVREQYQTLIVDADGEDAARDKALALFFAGSAAYMACAQVEPPTARVRPMREKHQRKTEPAQGDAPADFRTAPCFQASGDAVVQPTGQFPGTRPAAVTCAQAWLLCRNFEACGHSNHSGQGTTLWVILEHCTATDVAFNLRALPGLGYYVERARATGDGLALRLPVETTYADLD